MNSAIFQLSPFIEEQFRKHSELSELLHSESFDLKKDWQQYQSQHRHLDDFQITRNYRKSRLALIAARDERFSSSAENHLSTLTSTSSLADLMVQYVVDKVREEFEAKYGQVINAKGELQSFIVFALGKLGGAELNFSSDIDLVFCFSGKGESNGRKALEAEHYFDRFGRRVIQLLDTHTIDGRVYRVDMRLRPFGSAAPLVCSLDHLLNYLQTEGRDWERYAWLRARGVAGNEMLISDMLKAIQPFIYRKYLDYGIFESLRQIKQQIIRKQMDDEDNVKLGKGGIREIEFIVQTLQLTFAGRDVQLRGSNLWQQLSRLHEKNHLSSSDHSDLQKAWLFLRKLENYCQIIDDQSRHHLPEDCTDLSLAMGFEAADDLLETWSQHRQAVHLIFSKMFLHNQSEESSQKSGVEIQAIKDSVANKKLPKLSKHKIYAALDAFNLPFKELEEELRDEVLQRYSQVIFSVARRSSYLSMLIESPYVLKNLVQHLRCGDYFSQAISKSPHLLELLFEQHDASEFDFEQQWNHFSKRHAFQDEEELLELLCQFKTRMQFLVVSEFVSGHRDTQTCCLQLSQLAEMILQKVVDYTFDYLMLQRELSDFNRDQLIIIAYGSLATHSMNLNSDFDLVFVWDGDINAEIHKALMRWVKRIIHFLSTPSYSGQLYPLDTQMRPNGNSGALVVSQSNFEDYQHNHAWIWELAAIIKTRCVYATEKQKLWFQQLKTKLLSTPREHQKVDSELSEMSVKLKQHGAKTHDREFEILGCILKNAENHPQLVDWPEAVNVIQDFNLLPAEQCEKFIAEHSAHLAAKLQASIHER